MRLRQLMIAHSSRVAISMVKRHILSELGDVAFTETDSGEKAIELIQEKEFNVIFSDSDLIDMSGLELHKKLQSLKLNAKTPFIIISAADTFKQEYIEQLQQAGIKDYLKIPFTAKEIIKKVNTVCNPRLWRAHGRFHIPDAIAIIHDKGKDIDTKLINISLGGIFCEILKDCQGFDLLSINQISLYIPTHKEYFQIKSLHCKLARMNVTDWEQDGTPKHLRVTLLFMNLSAEQDNIIGQVIEIAKEKDLYDREAT